MKTLEDWTKQLDYYSIKRVTVKGTIAKELGVSQALKVTCPSCSRGLIVKLSWIKGQYRTRPCFYCRNVAFVPHKIPPRK